MSSFLIGFLLFNALNSDSLGHQEFRQASSFETASIIPRNLIGDVVVLTLPTDNKKHFVLIHSSFSVGGVMHFIAVTLDDPETKLFFLKLRQEGVLEVVGVVMNKDKIKKVIKDFS